MNMAKENVASIFEQRARDKTSLIEDLKNDDQELVGQKIRMANLLEDEMKMLEDEIKSKKKEYDRLIYNEIPELFQDLQQLEVKLLDGSSIKIESFYSATIKLEDREEAYQWLRDHNYGDIIKNEVKVGFQSGEDEKASDLMQIIQKMGLAEKTENKETIHHGTLRKWVQERYEQPVPGEVVPVELFGIYNGKKAKIKRGTK